MTRDDYLKAVGSFEPDEHMKSRIAAKLDAGVPRLHRPLRRALVSALAAVLVLASLTGIAMAASPQLREAVLRFFHIAETERVPDDATVIGSQPVPGTDIGGRVTAWYIDVDFDGVYFPEPVRLNPDGSVAAFVIWYFDGETLTTYELEPQSCKFDVTWRDHVYSGKFWYCIDGGDLTVYSDGAEPGSPWAWRVNTITGRTDAVLLYVERGSQSDYECCPYLVDLETGEVSDFLAGTGADELRYAYEYSFAPDLSAAAISCQSGNADNVRTGWYCDLVEGELTEIGALTGTAANSGSFTPDGKLVVSKYGDGTASYWCYDPETGFTSEIFIDVPLAGGGSSSGLQAVNAQTGVWFDPDGSAGVVDLTTGERREIEGFEYGPNDFFSAAPGGTKLLYSSGSSGSGWTRLGILDLETGDFVAFDRIPRSDVKESVLGWFDNERVMILGRPNDADDGITYLYLYALK